MSKDLVKQDINFLETPLWFQDNEQAQQTQGYTWEDREGFVYRAGYKPPVKVDAILLYALLLHSQQKNWQQELTVSRYELLKECGLELSQSTYWYKRLVEGLERWTSVVVSFQGTFYDGKNYTSMQFHIIDSWKLDKENRKLSIKFSPEFLQRIQFSQFFKLIEFKEFRKLQSPLATRLYEILLKSFQGREKWEINALKLAQKIPMKEQYPADIIPKIKAAVNRINERTELKMKLEIRRPERGKAIFVFRKLAGLEEEREKPKGPVVWDVAEEQRGELEGLLELVPDEHRHKKTVLEVISRFLRKKGEAYTRENILYTNEHEPNNYRAYLAQSLRHNFAAPQEVPRGQTTPLSLPEQSSQVEALQPTEEEVEAEFNRRLKEMESVVLEYYLREVRIELAKERFQEDPTVHPDKIPHRDVQERLFRRLREEARCSLAASAPSSR